MFRKKKGEKLEAIAMFVWVFAVKGGRQGRFRENTLRALDFGTTKYVDDPSRTTDRKPVRSDTYDKPQVMTEPVTGYTHCATSARSILVGRSCRPESLAGLRGASHTTRAGRQNRVARTTQAVPFGGSLS